MSDVITDGSTLIDILKSLDAEWTKDNWPHDDEPRPRSYYSVAADRVAELEAALRRINALNDNPAKFSKEIQNVLDAAIDTRDTVFR